jgi:ABC-type glycerol-3-phosphate transport system substrate-binding protein
MLMTSSLLLLTLTASLFLAACGGNGGGKGTKPGTYTITISGTSGAITHTTTVSLTVQ